MPAAKSASSSDQAAPAKSKHKYVVVLDNRVPRKRVIRFETDGENLPFSNIYLSNMADLALGKPEKVRVTVEAA
jgi:hypothetical protein